MSFKLPPAGSFSLEQLSQSLGLPYVGDPDYVVRKACPLEDPSPDGLAFCEKPQHLKLNPSQLGILITPQEPANPGWNALISQHPRVSFAQAMKLLYPDPPALAGIHPSAWVDPTARVHPTAWIGPMCSLQAGCVVEEGSQLTAQVYLGANVRVGAHCLLQPGVSVDQDCQIGPECVLEPGVRLLGRVTLGRRVWLGARNTVRDSNLHQGVKTDNQAAVSPDCEVGDHALLISQSGLGPGTKMGPYSLVAAQALTVGHLELAAQVQVAGRAVVYESVTTPGTAMAGDPAVPYPLEMKARALRARALSYLKEAQARVVSVGEASESNRDGHPAGDQSAGA